MYEENIDVITRGDETITQAAIDSALAEAKGYLAAFDKTAIFTATGSNRNPLLLAFIKDIAVWRLIIMCNAGTDLQLRQDCYNRAVAWLREVQKGSVQPDLPALADPETGVEKSAPIRYGSNEKRNQHF